MVPEREVKKASLRNKKMLKKEPVGKRNTMAVDKALEIAENPTEFFQ